MISCDGAIYVCWGSENPHAKKISTSTSQTGPCALLFPPNFSISLSPRPYSVDQGSEDLEGLWEWGNTWESLAYDGREEKKACGAM